MSASGVTGVGLVLECFGIAGDEAGGPDVTLATSAKTVFDDHFDVSIEVD